MFPCSRYLVLLLCLVPLFGQAPVSVQVTQINNLTSANQVIDNRSIQRQCNTITFAVTGTSAWSVSAQYSDVANTGPWMTFAGSAATVTSTSAVPNGVAAGYHPFFRFNTTAGTTVVNMSCTNDFYLASGNFGTVFSVAMTVPSWLTVNITNPTTNPTIAITPTPAQTSHQVIGTCGTATAFSPCALVAGDLPLVPLSTGVTGVLPITNGGNGTGSPVLTPGSGIGITGSWANYTVSAIFNQGQTGAVTRNTSAKLAETVSVTDFGATGNGSTDVTTNIQNSANAVCVAGGGLLFFPAGTYIVSASITISCPMTIYGVARGASTIKNAAGSMVGVDFIAAADNVIFKNLTIDGNQANLGSAFRSNAWVLSNTYTRYNSVVNGTVSYIALQNVPGSTAITDTSFWLPVLTLTSGQATAAVNSGIGIEGRGNNLLVSNVEIMHEANWGVTVNAQGSSLSHLTLEDSYIHDIGIAAQGNNTTQAGVENYNGTLFDAKVIHNTFENIYSPTYGPGFSAAAFFVDAQPVKFGFNSIRNCLNARGGTLSADGDGTIVVSNIDYVGNTVLQDFYLNQDGTSGIESDGANFVSITSNVMSGIPADGIHFGGQIANAPVTNYSVIGNNIKIYSGATLVSPDAAIQIGVPVSGTVGGAANTVVSDNTIDCGGSMPFGIYVPTTSSSIEGRNNHIKNCTIGEMYDASSTANIPMADYSWVGGDTATVTNTSALTKMYGVADYAMPWGATAFNGTVMKFQGGGFYSSPASGAGTISLSLYVGATQVCAFSPITTPVSTTTGSYSFNAQAMVTSAGSVFCTGGSAVFNGNAGVSTNTAVVSVLSGTVTGFNQYAAYGVDLGAQFSVASSSLSITNTSMNIKLEYPGARNF